jgi:hypothetical protein
MCKLLKLKPSSTKRIFKLENFIQSPSKSRIWKLELFECSQILVGDVCLRADVIHLEHQKHSFHLLSWHVVFRNPVPVTLIEFQFFIGFSNLFRKFLTRWIPSNFWQGINLALWPTGDSRPALITKIKTFYCMTLWWLSENSRIFPVPAVVSEIHYFTP